MLRNKRILKNAGLLNEVKEYDFHMEIPDEILTIQAAFKKHNKSLFITGGAIRDALLKQAPHDFDLVTDALPNEVESILNSENIYNFPSGKAFGIISAVLNNQTFEIATFRTDSKEGDGRKPNSVEFADMQADHYRRDVTSGSLYFDIERNKIIDYSSGVEDIMSTPLRVRSVGNPMDRLEEDKLRAIRLVRFAHKYGSVLDTETIAAIKHFKDLKGVSNERIKDEFEKGLDSALKPELFVSDFIQYGFMNRMLPGIDFNTKLITGLRNPVLVIANLVLGNDSNKIIQALRIAKLSSDVIDTIIFLQNITNQFKDFSKLVFDPNVDNKWFDKLTKSKKLILQYGKISLPEILEWSKITHVNEHVVKSFMQFIPSFSQKDFPNKTGTELGMAISTANAKFFVNNL